MCIADGPSLPLDEQLHWLPQLPLFRVVHLLSLGWISVLCKLTGRLCSLACAPLALLSHVHVAVCASLALLTPVSSWHV